jgi:hypothetical protein
MYLLFVCEHASIVLTKYSRLFLIEETFLVFSSSSLVKKPYTYLFTKTGKLHLTPSDFDLFRSGTLHVLFFHPENGGDMFFRNAG